MYACTHARLKKGNQQASTAQQLLDAEPLRGDVEKPGRRRLRTFPPAFTI